MEELPVEIHREIIARIRRGSSARLCLMLVSTRWNKLVSESRGKYGYGPGHRGRRYYIDSAAFHGQTQLLLWLISMNFTVSYRTCRIAARLARCKNLDLLLKTTRDIQDVCERAALHDNLVLLQRVRSLGYTIHENVLAIARARRSQMVDNWLTTLSPLPKLSAESAAARGRIDLVASAILGQGRCDVPALYAAAAAHGHIHVLEWVHKRSFVDWNERTCAAAAAAGQYAVLSFLIGRGCRWNRDECYALAKNPPGWFTQWRSNPYYAW